MLWGPEWGRIGRDSNFLSCSFFIKKVKNVPLGANDHVVRARIPKNDLCGDRSCQRKFVRRESNRQPQAVSCISPVSFGILIRRTTFWGAPRPLDHFRHHHEVSVIANCALAGVSDENRFRLRSTHLLFEHFMPSCWWQGRQIVYYSESDWIRQVEPFLSPRPIPVTNFEQVHSVRRKLEQPQSRYSRRLNTSDSLLKAPSANQMCPGR